MANQNTKVKERERGEKAEAKRQRKEERRAGKVRTADDRGEESPQKLDS